MRVLLFVLLALAAPKKKAEDDRVEVAGMLVREGDWARAGALLTQIDPDQKGLDVARYWTLRGLVALNLKEPTAAVSAFEAALAAEPENKALIELHLARAHLSAGNPEKSLAALDRAGEVGAQQPGSWLLRAECQEKLGRPDDALTALEAGATRFDSVVELHRQQVFLLVRLGLYREARARGEALLARTDANPDDALAISEALRQGGDTAEALTILQAALLTTGDRRDLLVQAARAALDDRQPRAAARYLERASALDPTLYLQAAEAWRRAGDVEAALRNNAEVTDAAAKAKQRLGLLLEAESFDQAVALEDRVIRLGVSADDNVAYGLAYAWFRLGDNQRAEGWLKNIKSAEVFQRATELRQAMSTCDPQWGCG